MTPDPSLDRFNAGVAHDSPLSCWMDMYGLKDVWQWKYPGLKQYTCHSATYASFSRIDLMLTDGSLLSRTLGVEILPQGISDHAPVLLRLDVGSPSGPALWRLLGYWVTDERVAPGVAVGDWRTRGLWGGSGAGSLLGI